MSNGLYIVSKHTVHKVRIQGVGQKQRIEPPTKNGINLAATDLDIVTMLHGTTQGIS